MILDSVKKNAAEGVEFFDCTDVLTKATELKFAQFKINISDSDKELLIAFQKMMKSNIILAIKKGKKGKITEINLAEKIKKLDFINNDDASLVIDVILPAGNEENINPTLFVDAFCAVGNRRPEFVTIQRGLLYTSDMEVFR